METTRLTDNNLSISEENLKGVPFFKNKILNKTLGELEKEGIFVFPEGISETEDLDNAQMILQKINGSYKTGNIMGFLGFGKEKLIISSRFSGKDIKQNDYFLQYLLSRVINLPNLFELHTGLNSENQIIDILAFLFPRYLKLAMRKGVFKTYVRNEYNDCNVKGTINIAMHIRKNTPFVGNIAYSQREYSYDNHITELIRHTVEFIRNKPYGKQVLGRAKDEIKKIEEATSKFNRHELRKILTLNKKNVIRHAYYSEYRALQRLCILILQSEKQEIGFGSNKVYGVLFDGAWLWEEYINLLVADKFDHPKNKAKEGHQWLFSGDNGHPVGKIYPDFIGKNHSNQVVADAKYKPVNNISNADYFQVLSYMYRFNANTGYYFYPEKNENVGDKVLRLNSGFRPNTIARNDVTLTKIGIKIPQNVTDYEDFVRNMEKSEVEFVRKILI